MGPGCKSYFHSIEMFSLLAEIPAEGYYGSSSAGYFDGEGWPRLLRHPVHAAHGLRQQLRRRPLDSVLRLQAPVKNSCRTESLREGRLGEHAAHCLLQRQIQ